MWPGSLACCVAGARHPRLCDEPADFRTFRIGLFGLDKLGYVEKVAQAA
jgi:hypothetical protein